MAMKRIARWLNVVLAAVAVLAVMGVGALGVSPVPPLGQLLNPGTGVWTAAEDAALPGNTTLAISGLDHAVHVTFDSVGTAHIVAQDDHDLFMAVGYLHGTFRLTQMDLERRQGEGLLAQVLGKAALSTDEFERQLGLTTTATIEWAQLASDPAVHHSLLSYSAGVNAAISQQRASGHLPMMFKILGYQPAPWTPIDTLVVQGIMTQTLDFTTGPLQMALLARALGAQRALQLFPILPANNQHPYDTGPYQNAGVAPLSAPISTGATASAHGSVGGVSAQEALAAQSLLARIATLPSNAVHQGSNSNNWAVDGTKTASGMPLMAGDPHLSQTLPAIWYQIDAQAPDFRVAGVSIPGTPSVLIGHNDHISWSLTNTQNSATLYYAEQTDVAHPNQYYWNGAWHDMRIVHESIPIKGSAPEDFTIRSTIHGPIMNLLGQTTSVWWAGAEPSEDIAVIYRISQASNFTQFRDALKSWYAPSQNFVYADDHGNIGLISAGIYPIVPSSAQPWLPLPGDGSADVQGTIPFDAIPQVYDPPSHIVYSANQREVGPTYPYYIGTAFDFFSNGYRADEIWQTLSNATHLTAADMAKLQNNTTDYLATEIVPKLLASLQGQSLSASEQQALTVLQGWDGNMAVDSPAATIWWRFWNQYVYDTFNPTWQTFHVSTAQTTNIALYDNRSTGASTVLGEDLEAWTLSDPTNPLLALPDGTPRTAPQLMRQAFSDTVTALGKLMGGQPNSWAWGKIHSRQFPSLLQVDALGYGPRASGGDAWTVDAADGGYTSTAGPSWRFIVDWGSGKAIGVYPGGQSENPLSPWYSNQIAAWWSGDYYPLLNSSQAQAQPAARTWVLQPGS